MQLVHGIYTHDKFTEQHQYWCPQSEEYAAGSQLLTALRCGWTLTERRVVMREFWKSGVRPLKIYEFTLTKDHHFMVMPVLSNPYIERLIAQNKIQIVYDITPDHLVLPF